MKIKLATLNVWGLPEPLAADTHERTDAIAQHLVALDADIVAFQEVWTSTVKHALTNGNSYKASWYCQENLGGGGLMVLSRHPIQQASFVDYALRGLPQRLHQGDYYARKGFLHLQLATERGPLSVVTTHLQAPYDSDGDSEYVGIQAGQLVQLAGRQLSYSNHHGLLAEFDMEDRTPGPLPTPPREAMETARNLLEEGKTLAQNRREHERTMAAASVAAGSLYLSRSLRRRISRRRFLKVSLAALPIVAYPSAVGLLTLSEVFAADELRAYSDMLTLLDSLETQATGTAQQGNYSQANFPDDATQFP